MSRSRAATPAAKRRAGARKGAAPKKRAAPKKSTGPKRTAQKKTTAPKKRAAPKKSTGPKRTAQKKTTAPKKRTAPERAAAKRASTRRNSPSPSRATRRQPERRKARSGRRRGWSRPRPLRAARGAFTAIRWRYRLAIVGIMAASVAGGYMFWLRDSSLVAVTDVEVAGVTSGDRERIVSEITRVAAQQTTLHADPAAIEQVATAFPTVKSISVDPNFPHGMRIEVVERPPALLVEAGRDQVPAAADGTLLAGVEVDKADELPVLQINQLPPGGALEGDPLKQALIVGATPEPLRPMIEEIDYGDEYGVEVTLRGGIPVRFGSGARAAQKWTATAAVLADPKLDSLTYLDVRVPERPAAADPTA